MKKRVFTIALAATLVGTVTAQEVEHRKEVYVIKAGKASGINTATPTEQKEIGKAVMEFMYDYKYLTDTTDVSRNETDRMALQVAYGMSKFTSFRTMQIDSLIRVSTAEQIRANPDRYIGGETFSIYKNYPQGRFTVIDKVSTDWFLYEEDIPVLEWTLTDETCEILGYPCKSAVCNFRGRRWTAFYTDVVPVADGPWKFGGLPGFIMQVYDEGRQYEFTCVGINSKAAGKRAESDACIGFPEREQARTEFKADRAITIPEVPFNKTTRAKFYATKLRFDTDPFAYMMNVNGVNVEVKGADGKPRTDITQARTLQYDYIERDWK